MTNEQEIIKKTKMFGLNTYEAKIWVALLGKGVSTAGELSDIANVPRSRSYDILESLEKKGFVVMKLGKPIKYLVISPKEVLENTKKKIEKKAEKHISEIKGVKVSNLIKTFQELYEKNTDNSENIIAVLRGRNNIYKHIIFLLKNAKKEVIISFEKNTTEKPYAEIKDKLKINTKYIELGMRMQLVDDDNTIIFPISEEEVHPDYDLGVWIRNTQTTKFFKQLLTSV